MNTRRRTSHRVDLPPSVPVAIAVAIADADVQTRVAAFLRDLGAARLGFVDAMGGDPRLDGERR